ncbi:MAG: T9SS type A sorting domain-containing protein [Bacteroidetes bacterium]|nr:T9SS type A sorting domain-containing protein [Bacteroidota bacterium]
MYLYNAHFYNNIIGVYSEPNNGDTYGFGAFSITGTTFSSIGNFLPDYNGQPAHGGKPYAGIDLSDVVVSIGKIGGNTNHFLNMNFGIKVFRSNIEVVNNDFQNIFTVSGYPTKVIGTAVMCEGDTTLGLSGIPGSLTVFPVNTNSNTMLNCERGVYASYSDLVVSNCIINNVNTGVECTQSRLKRNVLITENTITARKYGIRLYDNAGAANMSAIFNSITIHGNTTNGATIGTAISVMEKNNISQTNYNISFNAPITIIDAHAGIELSSVFKPQVRCNNVLQKIASGHAISTVGISILSCVDAQVSQNLVKGYTTSNTTRIGVNTDQSINSLISCNSVDSTGFGFHFTSNNLNTNFRGNKMRSHFEGLHLTNTAVIDTQTFAGNRWYGNYWPWFGAVNLNLGFFNLRQSLFIVNPTDSTFSPGTPANNTFWFQFDTAANYVCSNINPCSSVQIVNDGGDVNLMELIALDSILTSGYIDESRDIAQSILFDFLMTDSALRNSSSIFTTFINNNPVLQSLYEVKLQYHDLRNAEDSAAILLLTLDNSIKVMVDTLRHYNQAIIDNPSLDLSTEINQANASLNIMKAAYSSLVQQFKIRENAILVNAEFYNTQINATGLPLENEETINSIQISYDLYGEDSIASQFPVFLNIAQQCPSQGGSAVYRARFFVALFNDSITYDDFSVCLAQGYYREMSPYLNQPAFETNLIIKPNPANEQVEIILENTYAQDYILRITDIEGRIKFHFNKATSDYKTNINTETLSPGIYFVLVNNFSGLHLSKN